MGPVKSRAKEVMVVRLHVQSVAADGTATIEGEFESSFAETESDGVKLAYDSRDPDLGEPENPGFKSAAALVNERFVLVIRSDGSIKQVKGFERTQDDMRRTMSELPPAWKTEFERFFSEEGLREMLGQHAIIFPSHEVKSGESWTQTSTIRLPMIGALSNTMTMTFKGLVEQAASTAAKIDVAATISHEPAAPGQSGGLMDDSEFSVRDGTGSGEIWFDHQRGRLIRQVVRNAMTIEMAYGSDRKITQRMQTVRTIELVEDAAPSSERPAARK